MRYGDIAILFRSRTRGARLIIEQLKAEGIPVEEGVFKVCIPTGKGNRVYAAHSR